MAIDLIGLIAVSCLFERVGRSLRRIVPVHTVHRTVQVSTVRTIAAKVVVVHSLRD